MQNIKTIILDEIKNASVHLYDISDPKDQKKLSENIEKEITAYIIEKIISKL